MATGIFLLNDRDVQTDFSLAVNDLAGWPGMVGAGARDVPILEGPEMQGGTFDPRTIRRKSGSATAKGIMSGGSPAAAMALLDALRELLMSAGEVTVRTVYASDRQCLAICTGFDGTAYFGENPNGVVNVALSFTVKDGVAVRRAPDGYALSTARTACPIGTAESRPIILVHGGGAALTNPVVTMRNAAGDVAQAMGFTVTLGANDALRIDCGRAMLSKIASGVISDAMAAGYWTSGDFPLLRPADAYVEAAAYPTVELSSSSGTPVGQISYVRRYA